MNQAASPQAILKPLPAALTSGLRDLLGERFSESSGVRDHHGKDESAYPVMPPQAVVFAHTTGEVAAVTRLCHQHQVPVIPYGTGTSLEGHVLALHGGVCIDLSQMNRVLTIYAEDLNVTVEAGVTRKQLNKELAHTGLFFPIDPGADASLGGMTATRASGTNAVRYGTMRENVMALTVVLADGRIIHTGGRAKKSAAGYDLTRLFVGSEGTLGIVTEVTVKLYPVPEAMSAATCCFASVDQAVQTVIQTVQLGVPVARMELLDKLTIEAVNRHSKTGLREAPTLFFEFHGSAASVEEQALTVQGIATDNGGMDFVWATRPEERTRLWQARHDAYFACLQLKPGSRAVSTDVCVPISRLAECITETNKDIAKASMPIPLFGHTGDGNFHLMILVDPDNAADVAEAEALNHRVVERALAMDGTCTGEHGIGIGKMDYLETEHGAAVEVMRALKRTLDPDNLLNPGKVLRI
jgi:D-lactate dehydrogenase (cytochrome)